MPKDKRSLVACPAPFQPESDTMPAVLTILASAVAAATAAPSLAQQPSCAAHMGACPGQPPVLLQTRQAMDKAGSSASHGVPQLPPPSRPLPGALQKTKSGHSEPPRQSHVSAATVSTHSEVDWEGYLLLKELRKQGFTCPGGRSFPPNSGELLFDCRLWRAAQQHSQDMGEKNYFSHYSPSGQDPFDRSEAQGFPTFNENIASGVADAAGTLEQWKKSDGHCTNMMEAGHNRMAVGYANVQGSTYKHYWTQLFGADTGAADDSCYRSGSAPAPSPSPAPNAGGGGRAPSAAPGVGGGGQGQACVDSDANCEWWASQGYCSGTYAAFTQEKCPKTCSTCR